MSTPKTNKTLDYELILIEKNGKFVFHIKALSLVASGNTIEEAYSKIIQKKIALIKEITDAGLSNELSMSSPNTTSTKTRKWGVFLNAIIATLVVVFIFFSFVIFPEIRKLERIKPGRIIEDAIIDSANPSHDMPAERKEALLKSIRIIRMRIKPFIEEAKLLFSEPCSCNPMLEKPKYQP